MPLNSSGMPFLTLRLNLAGLRSTYWSSPSPAGPIMRLHLVTLRLCFSRAWGVVP